MNPGLGLLMKVHGEPFQVTRGVETREEMGLKNKDSEGRAYVGFYPGTDIQPGDKLQGRVSGNSFEVHDVENALHAGKPYQLKAYTRAPRSASIVSHIHVGSMVNSAIQQGSPGATQTVAISQQYRESVADVIEAIAGCFEQLGLSSSEAEELAAEIETIKAQLRSSKPKPGIVTACIESIKTELTKVAARTAGLAAGAVATGLLKRLSALVIGS